MNSPCLDIELQLTGYAAGELDRAETEAVRQHLAECASCRAELKRELRLRELMGSLPLRRRDLEVEDLAPAARRRPLRGVARRWLAPVAALAAVLALVLLAGRFADTGPALSPAPRAAVGVESGSGSAPAWSEQELQQAQDEVEYTLALTARLLRKGERSAVQNVFGDRLPRAITDSLRKSLSTNEGDQG